MPPENEDLAGALDQFDRTEANLVKLEQVWEQIERGLPDGVVFGLETPQFAALLDDFSAIVAALPAVDGYRIEAVPVPPDELAQDRLDAWEIGIPDAAAQVERAAGDPGRQIALYRRRLEGARRTMVRDQAMAVRTSIESVLRDVDLGDGRAEWRATDRWAELAQLVQELDRLVGGMVPGNARWSDLHRHLRFAQSNDLADIVSMDWPSVRSELDKALYDDREPVPVAVDDLGELVRARPTGPVSTAVPWERLDAGQFEGLVFELVRLAEGYENANWLMRTNAPDRGRDIEVYRVTNDSLAGTRRHRVLVQCKHWLSKSVNIPDIVACLEAVKLWEPPRVDVLVIATSGRFTQDAVAWREKRDLDRELPAVEFWPDNQLEVLLARRPHIAASFGLR